MRLLPVPQKLMELWFPVSIVLQALCLIEGYPGGAPSGACEDMLPRHAEVLPQPSPAPYALLIDTRTFRPGKPVTVTISGPEYRGVLLEARTADSTNALGSWRLPPPDTKFLECTRNPHGAITHSNINPKSNTTVYSWIPPNVPDPVYFQATVAQQRAVFWMNVVSPTLTREEPGLSLAAAAAAGAGMDQETPLFVLSLGFFILKVLG